MDTVYAPIDYQFTPYVSGLTRVDGGYIRSDIHTWLDHGIDIPS